MSVIPYNPGTIPTKPAPKQGEEIVFSVNGMPPYKDLNQSIRNCKHPAHNRFKLLREKAIEAMAGRAWSFGGIELELKLFGAPNDYDKPAYEYLSGISDTLDGSSGQSFTFLPIIFEDDCQVNSGGYVFVESEDIGYEIHIKFCE